MPLPEIERETPDLIIPLREVYTGEYELNRFDKSYDEVPVEPKDRIVAVGFHDLEVLEGRVETPSQTLHAKVSRLFCKWPLHISGRSPLAMSRMASFKVRIGIVFYTCVFPRMASQP